MYPAGVIVRPGTLGHGEPSVPAAASIAHASLLGGLLPSCGATSQPFGQWRDSSSYCAFPNLGFEGGKTGWTVTGTTSIVSTNEPWHVSGPGTHALQLSPGASALSSPLPVSLLDPWIRFFARSAAANGSLHVQVLFHGLTGNLTGPAQLREHLARRLLELAAHPDVLSTLALPLLTATAQVRLTSQATSGSWQIDDVYLDPRVVKLG
jgi:hypothetical protein